VRIRCALGVFTTVLFGPAAGLRAIAAGFPRERLPKVPDPNAGSGHGALRNARGGAGALTIVLLCSAGLLIPPLSRLGQVSLGFNRSAFSRCASMRAGAKLAIASACSSA